MRIAVFLDVDNTLTTDFIQKQYAKALGCEAEYKVLEDKFQKEANSKAFGDELVQLFAGKDFTEEKAKELFSKVPLQKWTDGLLRMPGIDKYLVSSGPSYYIDLLAREYGVPQENVFRSVYRFQHHAPYTIESCEAVSDQNKARFVEERKGKYEITLGVGDSEKHDGPFLSQVTIPLLRGHTENYISISDFQSVILVIDSLLKIAQVEVTDESFVTLVKEKCKQNPKLIPELQKIFPSQTVDDEGLLALLKERSDENPRLIKELQGIYPVLPVALMALALLVVVLPALSLAHHLLGAVPAILAILSLVAGGLLLISYLKPPRKAAFWWVASLCYVAQMVFVFSICRDAFADPANQWGQHELFWGVIVTIVMLLAAPALGEPARKLTSKAAAAGTRPETT